MSKSKGVKILLVDDEPDFTQPIEFWLKSKGYTVLIAREGKSALEIIKADSPDMVFLDLKMPVMDGIETLRNIRKFNTDLPVIIITVEYANDKKFEEANKLGSSGFFPKKGSFEELESIIGVTLRTHKTLKDK
ncbi:MAG: response regulator [Candidatus Omnitrophota bacterium]